MQDDRKRVICYVDGLNVYHGLKRGTHRNYLWLDIPSLVEHFLKGRQSLNAIKYFTSPMRGDLAKKARQQVYIDALRLDLRLEVISGKVKEHEEHCRKCGHLRLVRREKETDTGMSSEIVKDVFKDEFDVAILLTGDTDFVPPARIVREEFPEKEIFVLKPFNCGPCDDLKAQATDYARIKMKHLISFQFPDKVTTRDGYIVERPETFQWPIPAQTASATP